MSKRSAIHRDLRTPKYRSRVVKSKKAYSRHRLKFIEMVRQWRNVDQWRAEINRDFLEHNRRKKPLD